MPFLPSPAVSNDSSLPDSHSSPRTLHGYTSEREPRRCFDGLDEALQAVADKQKQVLPYGRNMVF